MLHLLFFTSPSQWLSLHWYSELSLGAETKIHTAAGMYWSSPSTSLLLWALWLSICFLSPYLLTKPSFVCFYLLSCTQYSSTPHSPLSLSPLTRSLTPNLSSAHAVLSGALLAALCMRQNCLPSSSFVSPTIHLLTTVRIKNTARVSLKTSQHIYGAFEDGFVGDVSTCWFLHAARKTNLVHFVYFKPRRGEFYWYKLIWQGARHIPTCNTCIVAKFNTVGMVN